MKRCYTDTWALPCLAIFLMAGCAGETNAGPDLKRLVPLSGIVMLDGKPLPDATVVFHPKTTDGFHGAIGRTDESGKYELETDLGNGKTKKGVLPGSYDVTVTKLVKPDGTPVNIDPTAAGGPMSLGAMQSIPMRYATVNEMGLTFIAPPTGGTYDIAMQGG
jgi:hypothetical protein